MINFVIKLSRNFKTNQITHQNQILNGKIALVVSFWKQKNTKWEK